MISHSTYDSPNGRVELINNDVLVRLDEPRKTTSGGISIPDTAGDRGDAGILATGTILAFGFIRHGGTDEPHNKIPIPGLSVGLKAVFIRFYSEQHSNQQVQLRVEPGVIRMKPADIMLVADPEDMDRILR